MLNTKVEFLKVPFTIEGEHQAFSFDKNASAQAKFFISNYKQASSIERVLLEPNDGKFRDKISYNVASKCNYIMFKNPSYGNKWFYAYITDIVPLSGNEMVEVFYQMDSVQSYLFEWYNNVRDSNVVREHIGKDYKKWVDNTLSEDVPTGKLEVIRVIDSIEDKGYYDRDINKHLIRWAVFIGTKTPAELDLIKNVDEEGGFYNGVGYKAKSNKIMQTLQYYVIPIRTDMKNNGGDIFINNKRAATVEEISDFFAEDILAVNSLLKVIIKNDLPIQGLEVNIDDLSGRIDITSQNLDEGNTVNIGGRTPIEEAKVDSWYDKVKNWIPDFLLNWLVITAANPLVLNPFTYNTWRKIIKQGDPEPELTVAGDVLIIDDSVTMETYGTTMAFTKDIYKGLYPDEPRLNYPPFTRYYIETENGIEKEFDVTKLMTDELILNYRTNMGPIDSSILTIPYYNYKSKVDNNSLQYEAFLQYSNTMSIPISTNQTASLLQGQQNQIATSLNHSLLDTAGGLVSAGIGVASAVATGGATGAGAAAFGAQSVMNPVMSLYKTRSAHEATMNDLKNKPNSVGQIGTDFSYNMINRRVNSMVKIKTVNGSYESLAIDHIKRNGQQVLRLKRPNFTSRQRWNFIECDLHFDSAGIPQNHIQNIKNVFNKGVTFWHTADIYDYSKDNKMR